MLTEKIWTKNAAMIAHKNGDPESYCTNKDENSD
jgi:hypothetical protein